MTAPVTVGTVIATVSPAAESESVRAPSRSPHAMSANMSVVRAIAFPSIALIPLIPLIPSTPLQLGIHTLDGALRRRHAFSPAQQRFLLGAFDLGLDLRFDVRECRPRRPLVDEILLVERDGVPPAPAREEVGIERIPRFGFVVRGVTAHAKRLRYEE